MELSIAQYKDLENFVYNYPTKYVQGFIWSEQNELLESFPHIDVEKFNDALNYITATTIDGNIVIYPQDIFSALLCGLEYRTLSALEFD